VSAPHLTAATITDDQIIELMASIPANAPFGSVNWQRLQECEVALFDIHSVGAPERRQLARARCAEILNARVKVQP
jgi:hypothetical protein